MASNYQIVADLVLNTGSIKTEVKKVQDLVSTGEEVGLTFQQANLILSKTADIISNMVEQVYDLDSALVEFRKVSDLSNAELSSYVDTLSELGKTVARTGSEMVEAATEFKKSGYTEEEAATLAQVAAMYQNIADTEVSAADASASLISVLKAFNYTADEAIHVADAYNATANSFAVGTNDLSSALEIAGAGMAVYGNEFEEVIGLVTAGTEIMTGRSLICGLR